MLRHAIRGLVRTPAFTISTVLTLALGVGANTGAFSAVDTLLLSPLPYPEPQRLVALHETALDGKPREVAEGNLLDWRARSTLFESMAAYRPRSFGLTMGEHDAVTVIQTGMAMSDFFRVTGVPPSMGRTFTEAEETAEARVMVLTDRLWRRLFAADPRAVGRKVALNEEPYTIVGVMPPAFEYPMGDVLPDAFIPLSRRDYCCARMGSLAAVARLQREVSIDAAQDELKSVARGIAAEHPDTNRGRSASLEPLARQMTGARREPLLLLLGASCLLLLSACANVTGLMLGRWMARAHETAIRASLGAGWRQIAGPFFAEAALLSVAGACCGLFAASLVLRAVPRFIPGAALAGPLHLNAAAFAFAAGLTAVVAALLGVLPPWFARRTDLYSVIKGGGRATSRHSSGLRGVLVMAQVALSVVLLLSAGLLLRSFLHLMNTSPGFETAHAFRFGLGIPEKRYDTDLKEIEFHRQLLEKLTAIPGVISAGAAGRVPLRGETGMSGSFQIAGQNTPAAQRPRVAINVASPGYFAAMGIPLMEGRAFSWSEDRPGEHRVVIVNQAFVRSYLRERHALGTELEHGISELNPPGSTWEIVGVVGDTRQGGMDREPVPEIFLSMTQSGADGAGYAIRTLRDDAGIPKAIAAAVAQQDSRIQRVRPAPLNTLVETNLASRDAAIQLVGGFGALALLLTAVGIYGVVAFRAAERSREMAIRMALGATAGEVRGLIFGQGFRFGVGGLSAGTAGFFAASPLLKNQLYGVGVADPATLAIVALAVLAVALAASAVPSRRAASVQPAELLRDH